MNEKLTNTTNTDDLEALKSALFGLAIACPISKNPNPESCQLHKIRLLSTEERFKWIQGLSAEELYAYYSAHQDCLFKQENS